MISVAILRRKRLIPNHSTGEEAKIKKAITIKEKCGLLKKSPIWHQKFTENQQNELKDMLHKYQLWYYVNDEYFQYDLSTCLADLSSALEESQEFTKDLSIHLLLPKK
jgi:hypothetical protein